MKDGNIKNKAGLKYNSWRKSVDYLIRKIDERDKREEFDLGYHQSENETGRLWSF